MEYFQIEERFGTRPHPNQPFQLLFNASLKVDFHGSRVTSNGGPILVRELDERLGLEKLIEEHLSDSRQGLNKQFTLANLLVGSMCIALIPSRGANRKTKTRGPRRREEASFLAVE